MTRKEQIIEILDKYWIRRGWIESDESMVESRPLTARDELIDAIIALPIEMPGDEEIENMYSIVLDRIIEEHKINPVKISDEVIHALKDVQLSNECRQQGAKWMRDEIIKRNGV